MWCMRWLLPLAVLPYPTASPFFLIVFLVSLYLHTRPCFYCMLFIAFLFRASCFWQTVPIDTPLTKPLGNATTFAEAVLANLTLPSSSNSSFLYTATTPQLELPSHIQLVDHCWCDVFSSRGLFEPTDVCDWERASVERLQQTLLERAKAVEQEKAAKEAAANSEKRSAEDGASVEGSTTHEDSPAESRSPTKQQGKRQRLFYRLRSLVRSTMPVEPPESSPPPSPSALLETAAPSDTPFLRAADDSVDSKELPKQITPRKWLYDLRPYGLDVTVDFKWGRESP